MHKQDPHRGVLVQLGLLDGAGADGHRTGDQKERGRTQGDVRLLQQFAGLYGRGLLNLHHRRKRESVLWFFRVSSSSVHRLSKREYRSGLPLSPGDLPDTGIKAMSLVSPALQTFFTTAPPGKPGSPLPLSFAHAEHTPGRLKPST